MIFCDQLLSFGRTVFKAPPWSNSSHALFLVIALCAFTTDLSFHRLIDPAFHFVAVMNHVALNIWRIWGGHTLSFLLAEYLGVDIILYLTFGWTTQSVLWNKSPFSPHPCHCPFDSSHSGVRMCVHVCVCVKWGLTVVLIYISIVANDAKHLFICLLVIRTPLQLAPPGQAPQP